MIHQDYLRRREGQAWYKQYKERHNQDTKEWECYKTFRDTGYVLSDCNQEKTMNWLEQVAPTIATALGGPLAGLAVEAVSKALGVSGDEAKNILDEGKMSADQIAQVKVAELELQKQAQALGLNFEQLAVQDRSSARDMQIATKSFLVPTLAIIIVVSFIGVVVGTMMGLSHIESAMAGTLVGYLSAKAEQVVAFYFGSSAGSQRKDELLHQSTPVP